VALSSTSGSQEVHSVERAYIVSASPERIWSQLVVAENIRPSEIGSAWMYRIGVPLPESAVTEVIDGKEVRHIRMGKRIHFDQTAADGSPTDESAGCTASPAIRSRQLRSMTMSDRWHALDVLDTEYSRDNCHWN